MGKDTLSQKLLSLEDVAKLLDVTQREVEELAQRGQIEAYRIGGTYLRFRQDQVESLKKKLAEAELEIERAVRWKVPDAMVAADPSLADRLKDFWYFNNFYIISVVIIVILIILILR